MTDAARPTLPVRPRHRDWDAPALVAASLLVHAVALALLIRTPPAAAARPPAEIPIEVVREMPAAKSAPSPVEKSAAKAEAAKTPERTEKHAAKSAEKAAAPRPSKAAAAAPKPPAARRAGTPDASRQNVAERMQQLLGPMPAAVVPTATSADNPLDDSASYKQMVLSKVARQRREDRHNGIPGHVVVAFTLGDAGDVVTCAVREKSIDPALDSEAVAMVYRGAPYPPPPPGAERAFSFGLAFRPT